MNLQRQTYFSVSSEGVPIRNIADYSPFGVQLDGRTISGDFYRYGFNGMEGDNEVKGQGNSYTTEFRQYDARLGRWLSLDPLMEKFPWQSPYCAMDNNPIYLVDPQGDAAGGPVDGDDPKKEGSKSSSKSGNSDSGSGITKGLDKVVKNINKSLDAPKKSVPKAPTSKPSTSNNSKNGNKSKGNSQKSNFSNILSFQGWHDQNPPVESLIIYSSFTFTDQRGIYNSSIEMENSQTSSVEINSVETRQTDVIGFPPLELSAKAGFDFKINEVNSDVNVYQQFEISQSFGYVSLVGYVNSKGEYGIKLDFGIGLDTFLPFSISNSTVHEKKRQIK